MEQRKNKIWGVIKDGIYYDYKEELNNWGNDVNIKTISTLRNIEVDEDLNGTHVLFCPYCEKPVRIIYRESLKYPYIKHRFDSDANQCISEDKSKENERQLIIRARKYEGREIGYLHKQVVSQIASIIKSCDNYELIRSSETKRVYHIDGQGSYRIPDIYFSYGDLKIAIEVQNSPEWVKVIAERGKFYSENGIYLIWIFTKNSLINNSASSMDISSRQSFNVFVFDDECCRESIENKDLVFLCKYDNYKCCSDGKTFKRKRYNAQDFIGLYDLIYIEGRMPYYFDHDASLSSVSNDCFVRNGVNERILNRSPRVGSENYYWYMIDSGYFARFKVFSDEKADVVSRLHLIASCYIAVIFLYGALSMEGNREYALALSKKGVLSKKFNEAKEFWSLLSKGDAKAKDMFNGNSRTTPVTIREWKETLTSSENDFAKFFPKFDNLRIKALKVIDAIERNILSQDT